MAYDVIQSVSYGSGSFSGTEYTDTVTLGSLTVTKQSIGVASTASVASSCVLSFSY